MRMSIGPFCLGRGTLAGMAAKVNWRTDPRVCAFIECDWAREDMETLKLLCGACIDASEYVTGGSTMANMVQEPIARAAQRS